jgi:hypothetical protein
MSLSRRHFFFGTLLAGAIPAGGFGSTMSLSRAGYKSPSDKLNIAVIGAGSRASQIVPDAAASENIVALCDVNQERAARMYEMYPKAARHIDFRKMLDAEGQSIDAVIAATPDHLHTPVSLLAMQRGKHVYCEKPLTRTPWEARLLGEAAAKYRVATQMGNQGFSHEGTKTTCEILWSGDLGEVRTLYAWTTQAMGGGRGIPATGLEKQPVPATLNWDLFLGPAADRDFNATMLGWRSFIDFSAGGSLGDWLVHSMGPAHLALHLDQAPPTSVECVSIVGKHNLQWPSSYHLIYEFPARGNMPPLTIHAYGAMRGDEFKNPPGMAENEPLLPTMGNLAEDKNRQFVGSPSDGMGLVGAALDVNGRPVPRAPAGARAGGPAGAPARAGTIGAPAAGRGAAPGGGPGGGLPAGERAPGNGSVFVGSKGYMATTNRGEGVWLRPASRWAEYRLPPQSLTRGVNHVQDWIRACKGGTPGVSDFAVTTKYLEWLTLGVAALRVPNVKLLWDAKNQRFSNNQEATSYLKPFMRKGWEMKV